MSLASEVSKSRLLQPSSQSRILMANNSKVNHCPTQSDLHGGSKVSLRRPQHTKSNSVLSMSRGVQSFVRQREVDKLSLPENQYQFLSLRVSELMKGFKILLNSNGKDISKIRIDSDTIQVQKNQIKHTFDVPKKREAKLIRIIFSSLTDAKLTITLESVLAKFKPSSLVTNTSQEEFIELDPYKLIQEAEEIRKRKFNESTSKSHLISRASLKIGESRKLLFNNIRPPLEHSKLQKLSASQVIICKEPEQQGAEKPQQQKLQQTLYLRKQGSNKNEKFKKPFQQKSTKPNGESCLDISTSSIKTQPIIYEHSSTRNLPKPSNQHLFKRRAKPTTYTQIALSKMGVSTSRIQ